MQPTRKWLMPVLPLAGVLCTAGLAGAQAAGDGQAIAQTGTAAGRTVYIFASGLGLNGNTVGAWGNGKAAEPTSEAGVAGYQSVKISTRDFYEGGRFDLASPIDLEPFRKNGNFRIKIHFYDKSEPVAAAKPGAPFGMPAAPAFPNPFTMPGGLPMPMPAPVIGQGDAPGMGVGRVQTEINDQFFNGLPPAGGPAKGGPFGTGRGVPGMPNGGRSIAGPPAQDPLLTELRVTLVREKGVSVGVIAIGDLNRTPHDDDGWRSYFLPVAQLHSTLGASGPVRRIILSGDKQDDFYVSELALVNENDRISVSIRQASDVQGAVVGEVTVKPGVLWLVADVEAGTADTVVEWNFDADNVGNLPPGAISGGTVAADTGAAGADPTNPVAQVAVPAGPRIDAQGMSARFNYPNEEQNYRVEATVRDRQGRKAPAKASLLVKVRG